MATDAADQQAPAARPAFWRSLDELAGSREFEEYLYREFPRHASELRDPVTRRNFLKLMGASLALAGVGGVAGCTRQPREEIIPYVTPPEVLVPGKPLFFATAMPFGGYGTGLLAEQHMGRPTKVEGNPDHPASLGATNAFAQASVLTLWDPDRAQAVTRQGQISSWSGFLGFMNREVLNRGQNLRLRILTETVTSPTLAARVNALIQKYPGTKWHHYEPAGRDNANAGAQQAFGRVVNTVYDFSKADRILSLDADFLYEMPGSVRYAREFIDKRRVRYAPVENGVNGAAVSDDGKISGEGMPTARNFTEPGPGAPVYVESTVPTTQPAEGQQQGQAGQVGVGMSGHGAGQTTQTMSRLYMAESSPTITGAMADHRVNLRASEVEAFARAVLQELQGGGNSAAPTTQPSADPRAALIRALAEDLRGARGKSIVIAGERQPPAVHVLAHVMNGLLGNVGQTVTYTEPVEVQPDDSIASLRDLTGAMERNEFDVLVILGDNPAFTAPADLGFADTLLKFASVSGHVVVHSSLYYNETSLRSHWHVPESHYLEQWCDVRAFDGTASIIQPLIAPLYESKSNLELIEALLGNPETSARDLVMNTWREKLGAGGGGDFQQAWNDALRRGTVPNTAAPRVDVTAKAEAANPSSPASQPAPSGGLEVIFRPDPCIWDGRFYNNGWLQELPKPLTKLTWDNAAIVSWATARDVLKLVKDGDDSRAARGRMIVLKARGADGKERTVRAPLWIQPNHPDNAVTVYLGYGRDLQPRMDNQAETTGKGFNAYAIRTSDALWFHPGVQFELADETYPLACTQEHQVIKSEELDARDIIRVLPLASVRQQHSEGGGRGREREPIHLSLYPEWPYEGHKWGMAIDMNACIGCNACTVACQSENNIAIVGKEQVILNREMHWLRIDTYYQGDDPGHAQGPYFQPMMCQHCEKAPCEVVCPVNATTHSREGINEMTYNRCVGTRYCSNNCPYKVRRFNFLSVGEFAPAFQMMHNPDVTVRERGVMEKCTYCVQRVNDARRELKKIDAQMRDQPKGASSDPQRNANYKKQMDLVMAGLETACQQACPTEAIVFGDLNWVFADGRRHEVVYHKQQEENFEVLRELITQPRTSYLPRLKNPNPAVPGAAMASIRAGAGH